MGDQESRIGSPGWLNGLGFVEWVPMSHFLDDRWTEYRRRPALQEPGLYAVILSDGSPPVAVADRFLRTQVGPSGLALPEVPNKNKPGQWRRRWWAVEDLEERWIEDVHLLYLGKSDPQLKVRLGQLRTFALGGLRHTGGQVLWHLRGYPESLQIGVLPSSRFPTRLPAKPRDAEKQLLAEFRSYHGRLPFANVIN